MTKSTCFRILDWGSIPAQLEFPWSTGVKGEGNFRAGIILWENFVLKEGGEKWVSAAQSRCQWHCILWVHSFWASG